ncbi:MAG: IS21 family transposase [Pseudomonadota bacterium]|nr:IS21 family transposase [Pseudomonadota bacterium]
MTLAESDAMVTMPSPIQQSGDEGMVGRERWEEIRRLFYEERRSISAIARALDLDRKTVRRCMRWYEWQPYRRAIKEDRLLGEHEAYLRERAPQVYYSARILYQELRGSRGYGGSYETVKRLVAPLRVLASAAERSQIRFETPPGQQSQIDWGEAKVEFRAGARVMHFFVLTLGFSRRSFFWATPNEQLGQFLEAHERAFEHFGGRTREHLYDRPRTVCRPSGEGKVIWNGTFRAFADYWGFEPRLCRAYRAMTKGKVESGVKYLKRNFLPGRTFIDSVDLQEKLDEWNATIADMRIHGTTHERPIERFERERSMLIPTAGQPSFLTDVRLSRMVASDYLVSLDTNRYSVPFTLIGQAVDVARCGGELRIFHRGALVAQHPRLLGRHQLSIDPAHGPGAMARNARRLLSSIGVGSAPADTRLTEVEVRDLGIYEHLLEEVL